MSNYSESDILYILERSSLTYQEAADLLEFHDGNLATALTDLEMNGRLKEAGSKKTNEEDPKMDKDQMNKERERCRAEARACAKSAGEKILAFVKKLCHIDLKVSRFGQQKFSLPLIACVIFGLISFPLTLTALILGLVFGYSMQVETNGVTF